MSSKIRHLVIKTKSPVRLAKSCEQVFDMKVIRTGKNGAIYMSDGNVTLAIRRRSPLKPRPAAGRGTCPA